MMTLMSRTSSRNIIVKISLLYVESLSFQVCVQVMPILNVALVELQIRQYHVYYVDKC